MQIALKLIKYKYDIHAYLQNTFYKTEIILIFVYMMFLMSVLEPPMIPQLTGYNIGFSIEFYL